MCKTRPRLSSMTLACMVNNPLPWCLAISPTVSQQHSICTRISSLCSSPGSASCDSQRGREQPRDCSYRTPYSQQWVRSKFSRYNPAFQRSRTWLCMSCSQHKRSSRWMMQGEPDRAQEQTQQVSSSLPSCIHGPAFNTQPHSQLHGESSSPLVRPDPTRHGLHWLANPASESR